MFAKKKNKNIIVIFFIVSFWSCNQTESSTNFKDIDVYTSFENEIHIKDILDGHLFDFKYFTPSPQNKYTTQIKNTNLFIVFIDLLDYWCNNLSKVSKMKSMRIFCFLASEFLGKI